MYAIVEINGQQFKAEAGKKLFVHHIEGAEAGQAVEFEKVLLVDNDGNITDSKFKDPDHYWYGIYRGI